MSKQLLKGLMSQQGMDQKQVANALGVSITTISQYLAGKYQGRVEELDMKVEALIATYKAKVLEKKLNVTFVPTFAARKMMDLINEVHVEGDMGMIYGDAGLGKTQAVLQYARQNSAAVVIETDGSYSPKVLLQKLCGALKLDGRGTIDQLMDLIIGRLVGSSRVLLIDEAENLSTRSLEFLRRIHDKSGVGVVLVGMPQLLVNLRGRRGELKQLYSRVWRHCPLGNELSASDLALLTENTLGTKEFNTLFVKYSQGNARRLNKLIRGAVRLAHLNECPIDEDLIKEYTKLLIN
ncbi:transcriptional regulator [Pasteurellaceae bacterium Macca]|nr:transcriptional regulator [Pasteurellaceae bacterium Macca]